jgi:hypothetical protein
MTSYLVLSYDTLDELVGEVNRKGLEGWRPQGGLSVLPGTNSFIFLQALIREEDDATIVLDPNSTLLAESREDDAPSSIGELRACALA